MTSPAVVVGTAGELDLPHAAALPPEDVARLLGTTTGGLGDAEAAQRLRRYGPNAVRSHRARALPVLWRQVRSPLLLLLVLTATVSGILGEGTDAVIIGVIVLGSTTLGFVNEYQAERAAAALHQQVRHTCVVVRDGQARAVDVTDLVPGDLVDLSLGEVVPADLRLLETTGLACAESVLTGESVPVAKDPEPVPAGTPLAELSSCALMGTVVQAGSGRGLVVATGGRAEFGRIALDLGEQEPETAFQIGLRQFSLLLVQVAGALTACIFVINVALQRPLLDAVLFSLAIAVGISPQLLPAVVATSLATGSRRLAQRRVLVKRLVAIEDLGNVDVLLTDKTGTLTDGRIHYMRSVAAEGRPTDEPLMLGLVCTEGRVDAGSASAALDAALWEAPVAAGATTAVEAYHRLAALPFDHNRRLASVLVEDAAGGRQLVTKGAPESVFARAASVPAGLRDAADREFAAGNRVVAVAVRAARGETGLTAADEHDLEVRGLLVFLDPPKPTAVSALRRLAELGITTKVVTGDNAAVARRVCTEMGLPSDVVVTGPDLDGVADDDDLDRLVAGSAVFARVSPEHKSRIVRSQRRLGGVVAFLGDGVNDALALHTADVGISVDSATDVAKDAADVLLLEKDLDVLADGVAEGRRIFANTVKYVLMGTSSNLGNMLSAAGASAFLSFLPMLPSQILLNNLLYDTSQLAIPTDEVDPEQLTRPAHWDIGFVRRFMLVFGPISSLFDVLTFVVMLEVFSAGPSLFRSGWFVESLATQTLVIFAVRTRRVPFWRSRPSTPLLLSALGVAAVGAALPFTPLAPALGFQPLPSGFFAVLVVFVVVYLALIDAVKSWFFARESRRVPTTARPSGHDRRVHRRASRFGVKHSDAKDGAGLDRARDV